MQTVLIDTSSRWRGGEHSTHDLAWCISIWRRVICYCRFVYLIGSADLIIISLNLKSIASYVLLDFSNMLVVRSPNPITTSTQYKCMASWEFLGGIPACNPSFLFFLYACCSRPSLFRIDVRKLRQGWERGVS